MARKSRKAKRSASAQQITQAESRIWRALLYVRRSRDVIDKESDSLESQIEILRAYVREHPDLHEIALYVDDGCTGTNFDRSAFSRMMEAVESGDADCIIIKDLSRLGRNYIETGNFIEHIFPLYGLRLISVNDYLDTAAAESNDTAYIALTNLYNDYYAKDVSRKVSSALKTKMEMGEYIGSYAPYGYRKDPDNKNHLLVDPYAKPVICQIFEWRAEGISYAGINKKLNQAGILSPGQYRLSRDIITGNNRKERPILWNQHVVTEILHNIVYIGHTAQRKVQKSLYDGLPRKRADPSEWIVVKNTHEPLISTDLFDRVQEVNRAAADRAKHNAGKYDHLPKAQNLYGKKLICGCCGSTMKEYRSISRKKDAAYFSYGCTARAEHGLLACANGRVKKELLDQAVLTAIRTHIERFPEAAKALHAPNAPQPSAVKEAKQVQQELDLLHSKLNEKRSFRIHLYTDLKDDILTKEEYLQHREILNRNIAALQMQLSALEDHQRRIAEQMAVKPKQEQAVVCRYGETDKLTKELVDALIERIYLNKDGSPDIRFRGTTEAAALSQSYGRPEEAP